MATGEYDRSVDSRVTCSICLEPYRGRQPKLLPCSHTFCLPCLTQIADKERQRLVQISGEEDEERDVSITCPTCRTPISLPPTGVSGLHANVYVDDAGDPPDPRPILCDLCEEGHKAQHKCATCKTYFDTRCRRIHDKFCKTGQVSEVTMTQPQAVYSRVGGAEEETENFFATRSSSELDVMESLLKKLGEKEKDEQNMKKSGSRRTLKSVPSSEASLTEDLAPDDKSMNPTVSLLMKKMTALENQLTVQQNQITLVTSLNDKHDKEIASFKSASKKDRDAMTMLEREVASLRDKNTILCQDKEQLRSEVTKLQTDVQKMQTDFTALKAEQHKSKGDFSRQVAFQAVREDSSVTLKKGETLICGRVISIVGGGYDPKTGVFTVPVAGVYCFMFTSTCGLDGIDKWCCLHIMLDDKDIAYMHSYGKTYKTAHTVIHASAGQRVFLRSYKVDNQFSRGWASTFTGFLVCPDHH